MATGVDPRRVVGPREGERVSGIWETMVVFYGSYQMHQITCPINAILTPSAMGNKSKPSIAHL